MSEYADDICAECGEMRSEHHEFVPVALPTGCKSDPEEWRLADVVPPICAVPVDDGDGRCDACEHDLACHATVSP